MAEKIKEAKVEIDAFISSPANRALTTAGYFAKAYGSSKKDIIVFKELYHASSAVFFDVISKIDDKYKTAAVFSHNPGITDFVNELTNTHIDNMPTCAVFAVKADIRHWKDFASAQKTCWFFDYPKR